MKYMVGRVPKNSLVLIDNIEYLGNKRTRVLLSQLNKIAKSKNLNIITTSLLPPKELGLPKDAILELNRQSNNICMF